MKVSFYVIPLNKVDSKSGEGANGPWESGTYLFQVVNGTDKLSAIAFGNNNTKVEQNIGKEIQVDFDIKCNEYNGKYYNNVSVQNVHVEVKQDVPGAEPSQERTVEQTQQVSAMAGNAQDDLPF